LDVLELMACLELKVTLDWIVSQARRDLKGLQGKEARRATQVFRVELVVLE